MPASSLVPSSKRNVTPSSVSSYRSNLFPHRTTPGSSASSSDCRNFCLGKCTFLFSSLTASATAPPSRAPWSASSSPPTRRRALCPYSPNTRPFASMLTCASLPTPRNANPSARSAAPPLYFCIVNPYPCFRASKRSSRSYTVARAPRCVNANANAAPPTPPPTIATRAAAPFAVAAPSTTPAPSHAAHSARFSGASRVVAPSSRSSRRRFFCALDSANVAPSPRHRSHAR